MRERLGQFLLIGILMISQTFSANAADSFPLPPEPQWWKQTGINDVRYGIWLPCRAEWDIANDCVQGINLYKIDGSEVGPLTYEVNPNVIPSKAIQKWSITTTPSGEKVENSAYIPELIGSVAQWKLPEGVKNSDGTNLINAYVHLMNSSLQLNSTSYDQDKGSLPEGYYFEYKVKSSGFAKRIKWVLSNVRDPQVKIDGDIITIKGIPENSASANFDDQVCEPNLLKAKTTQRNMVVNLVYFDAGNKTTDTRPDDVILGTNGWWCLSDFRFDSESQQIVVKVGNVHFDEYGNEIQGWMELKVKGSRARQWWGIDPAIAAGYAKVEISYQDGTKKIATVNSKYDAKNDWIDLRAYGFTYSSPQLAISFKKPPSSTNTVPQKKPMSITCVKGKVIKKVTATNPKCPSGYKKR